MIDTSDFRKSLKILHEDIPWEIVDFQHVKPGKGGAFVRTKLRNMLLGSVVEKTFRAGEKFAEPNLEFKKMQYLYNDGSYVFMDMDTYDQLSFTAEQVGEAADYLKENLEVFVVFFNGAPIAVHVPNHVVYTVVQTDPGLKGDTVSGTTKPATIETGAVIQVPLFIKEGDLIKVDTRSGEYIERVSA